MTYEQIINATSAEGMTAADALTFQLADRYNREFGKPLSAYQGRTVLETARKLLGRLDEHIADRVPFVAGQNNMTHFEDVSTGNHPGYNEREAVESAVRLEVEECVEMLRTYGEATGI